MWPTLPATVWLSCPLLLESTCRSSPGRPSNATPAPSCTCDPSSAHSSRTRRHDAGMSISLLLLLHVLCVRSSAENGVDFVHCGLSERMLVLGIGAAIIAAVMLILVTPLRMVDGIARGRVLERIAMRTRGRGGRRTSRRDRSTLMLFVVCMLFRFLCIECCLRCLASCALFGSCVVKSHSLQLLLDAIHVGHGLLL